MSDSGNPSRQQLEGNIRRFILFRLFFNVRFYYPVFTVLFLDYGLSLEQFAILNLVWALTIVFAEVPSGAMADLLGRKRLMVMASWLMLVEMGLLVLVPVGPSTLLFVVFLINRICSGLAEAAASGADEALAYDSLKALNREAEWAHLLEKTTRILSIGFFVTMITGALVYDHVLVNKLLHQVNPDWTLPRELVIKFPIILCLFTAGIVILASTGMKEFGENHDKRGTDSAGMMLSESLRQVLSAASWTISHRFVLFVILGALAIDSVARQFVVLASEYYRTIDIPTAWFGFIGAGMALLGIVNARISRYLATRHSPFFNFTALSVALLFGLVGIAMAIPWFGVLFAVFAFSMMSMVTFLSSYYINREVDSARRATVLSFRGLALNLGLGLASLLYTVLIASLKAGADPAFNAGQVQTRAFVDSLMAFPLYFLFLYILLLILGRRFIRRGHLCFKAG